MAMQQKDTAIIDSATNGVDTLGGTGSVAAV